jgi:hypothetical protein
MRNRTRVIAAAAAVAAVLSAGGSATALASTTAAAPSAHATTVSVKLRCAPDKDLAGLLGVPPARLDRALRAAKTSLATEDGKPTAAEFYAALARYLGISQARVRHAFAAEKACGTGPVGSKPGGPKPGGPQPVGSKPGCPQPASPKSAGAPSAAQPGQDALAAAVARELHVSTARVNAALAPIFAVGHADPSSPSFAAAARALGVSAGQLSTALMDAKQSLAGCG